MIGPFDLDSTLHVHSSEQYFRRSIVKVETAAGKTKSVKHATPSIKGDDAKFFQMFLPKYDELLLSNLETQQKLLEGAIALGDEDFVQRFVADNEGVLDGRHINKARVQSSLDTFFDINDYNSNLKSYFQSIDYKLDYEMFDTLRDEYYFYAFLHAEIKQHVLRMSDIPVTGTFCDYTGRSFELCTLEGTPFAIDNAFSDERLTVSAYYKYEGVYSHVVRVKNQTTDYMSVSNVDVLYDSTYYAVPISNGDIPPLSSREFIFEIPRQNATSFKTSSARASIPYGITARYESKGETYLLNQRIGYNPFLSVAN